MPGPPSAHSGTQACRTPVRLGRKREVPGPDTTSPADRTLGETDEDPGAASRAPEGQTLLLRARAM